jgi:hypothetical protein
MLLYKFWLALSVSSPRLTTAGPLDLDVRHDVSLAPGGFIADINTTGLIMLAYASGTLGLGLA